MKKRLLIAVYIFWVSLLVYIFMRLIHPAAPEPTQAISKLNSFIDTWTEPVTKIRFRQMPKGCFQMGSSLKEDSRGDDEGPLHTVCLEAFWMSENEITVQQFGRFVQETGYQTQAEKEGYSWFYDGEWKKRGGLHWKNPGFVQTDSHPVIHVTYHDALAMAQWLSAMNRRYSLPTESQWEYACRAGTNCSRFFGDNSDDSCQYANVADKAIKQKYTAWTVHSCNDSFQFTAPVGRFSPNQFGLNDILGNVWEWCLNTYVHQAYLHPEKFYAVHNERTPVAIRGGSWYSRPQFIRCANRDYVASSARRSADLGFRLVMYLRH